MKPRSHLFALALTLSLAAPAMGASLSENRVKVSTGVLEGTFNADTGVRSFEGIPFAQPPVGELRWKPPQPPRKWSGIRRADKFGPRAMQRSVFSDMVFRSDGMSEDCLYLNVWTPAKSGKERLPVLVYFYGGGFQAGDGSEPRYDGENMARRGIVAVTVNYRLNVFGFLAHPELTRESPRHASGNYGLMDQTSALLWVHRNIAAFGGDPRQVTIAGESAGSISVSAQMASPLSKGLFARAIGESGSLLGTLTPVPLSQAEEAGVKFATNNGANSLAELRAIPAEKLLEASGKRGGPRVGLTVDGYFFAEPPSLTFAAGKQAHVPLLAGWNSEEMNYRMVLGASEPTVDNFANELKRLYPEKAEEVLEAYKPANDSQVVPVATDLASDRFIAFSTWEWAHQHSRTSGQPVYEYYYAHPRPVLKAAGGNDNAPKGAVHSAEIEYALGNLAGNKAYAWTPEDYKVSETLQTYFANFIKTADPNGPGLPEWPAVKPSEENYMRIDLKSRAETRQPQRYLLLEKLSEKK